MEDLIAQFSFLSDEALHDKSFDPTAIEGLVKLFEVEAYNSWAAMELSCSQEAQNSLQEAEDWPMEEFRRFEEETERNELRGLVQIGKVESCMEKAATDKYVGATTSSAVASMRSTLKGLSSSHKVHPS